MGWIDCRLGDVITLKRGYDLPRKKRKVGSVPIVSSSGISGFHNEAKAEGPGVVTGRYGTLGEVFYIEGPYWPLNTTLYVQDFKDNHPRFVSYFLRTLDFASLSAAAAVPGLNRNHLHLLPVCHPPLPTQRKIAAILSAYDDLIENNLRRIKILEEMAQNLYREWFVKFRFPGHQSASFTDSPLGRIPEGWEVVALSEIVDLCRKGVQPQNFPDESFEHFSFPAYDSGRLPAIEKGQTIKSGKYEVRPNCLLVPKLNPHIPRVWLPRLSNDLRSIASTEYLILEPRKYSTAFYYVLFTSQEMASRLAARADGTSTSHKRLKPRDFLQQLIVAPSDSVSDAFDSLVVPATDLVISLVRKNTALRRTRDLLLPRLISGEVDVSDLDIAVPEEVEP